MIWKCVGCLFKQDPIILEDADVMYQGNSYCVACFNEFVLGEETK